MRAQRVWKIHGTGNDLGRLTSQLDDLNRRLNLLEKEHPERWRIDALKSSALSISKEIDDIRCAEATEALSELLRK